MTDALRSRQFQLKVELHKRVCCVVDADQSGVSGWQQTILLSSVLVQDRYHSSPEQQLILNTNK
jgi:hypothetical protein